MLPEIQLFIVAFGDVVGRYKSRFSEFTIEFERPLKALLPIDATLLGMVIDARAEQR
jgi:hypothetical protein